MSQEKRLILVLTLNLAMIGGLVIVGLSSHSLGVLAAGGDYLADAAAIGISLLALRMSRHPADFPKATSWAALINVVFLLAVTLVVIVEAMRRLSAQTYQIDALPVIIVSVIAAVVMIIGAFILGGDEPEEDLNMQAVILDTIADAAAAASVAIAGGIMLALQGFYWLDPIVALGVAGIIGYHALKLFRKVIRELRSN